MYVDCAARDSLIDRVINRHWLTPGLHACRDTSGWIRVRVEKLSRSSSATLVSRGIDEVDVDRVDHARVLVHDSDAQSAHKTIREAGIAADAFCPDREKDQPETKPRWVKERARRRTSCESQSNLFGSVSCCLFPTRHVMLVEFTSALLALHVVIQYGWARECDSIASFTTTPL